MSYNGSGSVVAVEPAHEDVEENFVVVRKAEPAGTNRFRMRFPSERNILVGSCLAVSFQHRLHAGDILGPVDGAGFLLNRKCLEHPILPQVKCQGIAERPPPHRQHPSDNFCGTTAVATRDIRRMLVGTAGFEPAAS